MGPTPEVPQESIPTSPKLCAVSSSQKQAYSTSGSMEQLQCGPEDARLVNTRLVEELRAVVIMNDKWQRYNKQQEKYRRDLESKLEEQRRKTKESEERYSHALQTQHLQEQKLKQQEETIKCFSSLMEELDQAKNKVKRLEEEMKNTKQTSEQNRNQDQDEKVKLLQYQLQVCIDDFNREESEKEKLQQTVKSLQVQIVEANHLLAEYREKVNIMKAIDFPTIHNGNPDNHHCQNEKPTVHRRRIKMSSSAPTKSNLTCRLDGINFPTNIEADSSKHSSRGCDLAPNFSASLEAEETVEAEPFDESLEMVRH